MTPKIVGALLILAACGGMGFSLASAHRRKEQMLRQIMTAVQYMACELEYRQPPLPTLMKRCAKETGGQIAQVFSCLAGELERQIAPDATCCMQQVLEAFPKLPWVVTEKLQLLGRSLGRFDLGGQLTGLETVHQLCKRELDGLLVDRDSRLRSYATLGLCAGAALVILFI